MYRDVLVLGFHLQQNCYGDFATVPRNRPRTPCAAPEFGFPGCQRWSASFKMVVSKQMSGKNGTNNMLNCVCTVKMFHFALICGLIGLLP